MITLNFGGIIAPLPPILGELYQIQVIAYNWGLLLGN
ncbi:hypothetical protein Dacsa_1818 [Dactylococcopsis salina PCC 8305]|uniref:Uncharacterized protein n=1 Tax=Dactylococcopsis salina (strain PCC 8305) TaxID=13035 RepID=K9YVV1_DACS8|nr:hypothetical protein Dacsa_1818 [Dactylococcopsis salina PCC 8305]